MRIDTVSCMAIQIACGLHAGTRSGASFRSLRTARRGQQREGEDAEQRAQELRAEDHSGIRRQRDGAIARDGIGAGTQEDGNGTGDRKLHRSLAEVAEKLDFVALHAQPSAGGVTGNAGVAGLPVVQRGR